MREHGVEIQELATDRCQQTRGRGQWAPPGRHADAANDDRRADAAPEPATARQQWIQGDRRQYGRHTGRHSQANIHGGCSPQ